MEANRSQFGVRLLPSLTDFAFLMPVVFLFARMDGLVTLLGDCDTGWHIRTGEWILAHHAVPARDIFSFSKPGETWYAWEWLSEIIFAWLYRHGGLATLALFAILLLAFTFTLLFRLVRRQSNAVIAIAVTILAMAGSAIHWLARPHLFTLLFLVLFYGALESVRAGKTHLGRVPLLVLLPAATILWTNLHGGFFVGIILAVSYGVGEVLKLVFSADAASRGPIRAAAMKYFATAGACLAASVINPYTYHLHVHIVQFLRDPYQPTVIMEFLPMSFHHPVAIFFEAMLLLSCLASFWYIGKGSFTQPVILLMWAHGALIASRNIPIFMILAAPPIGMALAAWLELLPQWNVANWLRRAVQKVNEVARETTETDAIGRVHLVSAAGVAALALLLYAPHPPKKFRPEFDPDRYPAKAVEVLRGDPDARVFTFDQWGDYMIYRLYPRARVFMDGRFDYYGDDFEKAMTDVLNVKYGWEKTLGKYAVNTILMPPNAPLTGALKESSRWRVVYDDGVALVFRSNNRESTQASAAGQGSGEGRDREITKTETRDQAITVTKPNI
jgi:hypothetical protein